MRVCVLVCIIYVLYPQWISITSIQRDNNHVLLIKYLLTVSIIYYYLLYFECTKTKFCFLRLGTYYFNITR